MNAAFFETYMSSRPEKPPDRYMFLVDSKDLSEQIVLAGYRSTPLLGFDADGFFTVDSFLEYMRSLEFKGSCRSEYTYIPACSSKTVNDTISSYLTMEGLQFKPGWMLFRGKEYLQQPEHEEELKKILQDFTKSEKASIKVMTMNEVQEEEVDWLIPGYIPGGQITLLVADGGQGKTSIWCNLVAGITSGKQTILEERIPFRTEPKTCMFFSSEDSVPKVLKKRLRKAGADESRILFVDLTDPGFDRIKFDSQELEELVAEYKPALVVFDPLQGFLPASVQMGSRNAMRQCMAHLVSLGERFGTAFLVIMHTNKKIGVSGRTRVADSADIWDISRSVMIAGQTGEDGLHYLSHEKSNYGALSETVLYTIEEGAVEYQGTTGKKDRDFVSENLQSVKAAPARGEAKELIMDILSDGEEHKVSDVDAIVKSSGVTFITLKRSKSELKTEGKIRYRTEGFGEKKAFFMSAVRERGLI